MRKSKVAAFSEQVDDLLMLGLGATIKRYKGRIIVGGSDGGFTFIDPKTGYVGAVYTSERLAKEAAKGDEKTKTTR